MNRPLHSVAAPLLLAAVAGLGLWRAMDSSPLATGIAGGAVAGLLAGIGMAWPSHASSSGRRVAGAALRLVLAVLIALAGLIVMTADVGIVSRLGTAVVTFLSIDLPAAGLSDLAVVPYVVVVPAATIATWAGRRGRTLVSVAAPAAALVVAALFAAPVGVPWWVSALFAVVVGVLLVIVSREHYTDMEPLVGTSTAIRRQLPWWRPAITGVLAVGVGLAALAIPLPGPFDVRSFIDPDIVTVEDESPLATAARLLRDPLPDAEGIDVAVDVDGESPGRLRLAVLDHYEPEGWRQQAQFAVTGEVVTPTDLDVIDGAAPSVVTVAQGPATTGLRGTPTAGSPVGVVDPDGVRFSSSAGLFVATDPAASVRYRTLPRAEVAPPGASSAPVGVPGELYRCPDSAIVDDIAGVLAAGTTEPLERLARIESWLKLTKIYDPEAPGGQTLRSVERFLSQDFARGNLEVLVTAYALLARCADVPVRVVVGYPAPQADARREYSAADVAAWVDTPIAGVGWVALDPVPTPEEQQRQAELASQPPPQPAEPPTRAEATPTTVEPTGVDTGPSVLQVVLWVLAALALVLGACWLWADGMRRRTLARRRRIADSAAAVRFAWRTVVETLLDSGIALGPHLTASETARATTGRVSPAVTRLMSELAGLVDRARFDAPSTTDEHAGLAWALADAALERQPMTWRRRAAPLLHPRRAVRRLRATRGLPRRREPWTGEVPASSLVTSPQDVVDIPGYEVEARIGSRLDVGGLSRAGPIERPHGGHQGVHHRHRRAQLRPPALRLGGPDRRAGVRPAQSSRGAQLGRHRGRPAVPRHQAVRAWHAAPPGPAWRPAVTWRGRLGRPATGDGAGDAAPAQHPARRRQAGERVHRRRRIDGARRPRVGMAARRRRAGGDDDAALRRAGGVARPCADGGVGHLLARADADVRRIGRAPMAGSPPREDEIVDAFGSDIALPLLEIDPRRRPRTALAAAHRLGLDVEEHVRRGPPVLALPDADVHAPAGLSRQSASPLGSPVRHARSMAGALSSTGSPSTCHRTAGCSPCQRTANDSVERGPAISPWASKSTPTHPAGIPSGNSTEPRANRRSTVATARTPIWAGSVSGRDSSRIPARIPPRSRSARCSPARARNSAAASRAAATSQPSQRAISSTAAATSGTRDVRSVELTHAHQLADAQEVARPGHRAGRRATVRSARR